MNKYLLDFAEWADDNGWDIVIRKDNILEFNPKIKHRYPKIPKEYEEFLGFFELVVSPNEKTWFLCIDDYNDKADTAFKWNEFEIISLEAAKGDAEWTAEIISWWDRYFPIMMSVQGGYSFYAIDLYENVGTIVKGREPEFEEIKIVADNIKDFILQIMERKIKFK